MEVRYSHKKPPMDSIPSQKKPSRIGGSHGGEYKEARLLSSIALMTEAVNTSESSVNSFQYIRQHNPEGSHIQVKTVHILTQCFFKIYLGITF
jgi:hypothetical protein